MLRAQRDDYESDPAGDFGSRVLCSLIGPAQPSAVGGRATLEGATVFPEGIAVDARTGHAYVGSSSEGHLYRIPAGGGRAELFQTGGSPGRQAAYGMQVDPQGRLWIAGGPHNTVSLVDLQGATTVAVAKGPAGPQAFLNDLAMARDGMVDVTDAFRPVVFRMRSTPGAALALEPWLDLSATPVRYVPNEVNFNGIVASPDGRWLLAVQTATGQLWRIDTRSRAVAQVRLEGGDLKGGDGLVLRGPGELIVVRNSDNELVRVLLADGWGTGRIAQRINDPRFKYPTTAALTPRGRMVVNGQLDKQKSPPPLLPFDVLTVGLPQQP
ncbi:SMP-30/gluconolactonase/LRE family protein [uncultured Xylophilus sp.]|uniref:SMP-30/gluconolactonase/LRE family protein n=1 Tax=uncultured Xylophilus sp. TaxID=296832 RepID=UPI0025D71FB7|nr:SMP-30/gluconolactonase/LRE family protein [uncultured Xylophilus sp.]